jgi:hypothetical protein
MEGLARWMFHGRTGKNRSFIGSSLINAVRKRSCISAVERWILDVPLCNMPLSNASTAIGISASGP